MRSFAIILFLLFNNFQFEGKQKILTQKPKLEVNISLNKTKFKIKEEIIVNLEIKNIGKKQEELIFETRSTSPRWKTSASVIDLKTKKSVIKWQTAFISSTFYTEKQLVPYKFKIRSGQIVKKNCKLSSLVVFDSPNFILPIGKYELTLIYYNKISNKVIFEVF